MMTTEQSSVDHGVGLRRAAHQLGLNRVRGWRRRQELAGTQRAGVRARRQIREILVYWLARVWRFLVVLGVFTVALAALSSVVMPDKLAPYVVGAVLASGGWLAYVVWLDSSGVAGLRAGISGEEMTITTMRSLRRHGWRLINHVMLEHRDVDHVLVGPGGLFAIESKYRSTWSAVSDDQLSTWARHATQAARGVFMRTQQRHAATPIIVLWGPRVSEVVPQPRHHRGVTLCTGSQLVDVLEAGPRVLDDGAIEDLFQSLDNYVQRRSIGEERDYGPTPRPVSGHVADLILGVFAGVLAIVSLASLARMGPDLATYLLGSVAFGVGAIAIRRRTKQPRTGAVALGVATASVFLLIGLAALATIQILT